MSPVAFRAVVVLAALLRVWLTSYAAPSVYRGGFRVDDAFYVRAAESLLAGEWLGPYHHNALVKRIGYSAFLAAANTLAVSRRLAEDGLLAIAALVLAWALRRVGLSWPTTLAAYLCCLFSPATYTMMILPRVLREDIYLAATVLVLALGIALVAPAALRARVEIALGLGLVLAWYWQTREESEWIVPSLAILLGAAAWGEWRAHGRVGPALATAGVLALIPAGLVWGADRWVRSTNEQAHGAPITVETMDPDFEAALAAFARVAQHDWQRWEPVTRCANGSTPRAPPSARSAP